jgi:non-homologous end joining protein Ku
MAHSLRIAPLFTTQRRPKAVALRSELNTLILRLMAADDEGRDARVAEARRLIKLAEELYERADELVKQAEELLPPDEVLPEAE